MNSTPRANRLHIALFGNRNAGKSSLINALTGQEIALVSEVLGTTTDPVYKAMELLPLGPVMLIDTAGIDDVGELGKLRVKKSLEVISKADVILFVIDASEDITPKEIEFIEKLPDFDRPFIVVANKTDQIKNKNLLLEKIGDKKLVFVSATQKYHINELKQAIIDVVPTEKVEPGLLEGLIAPNDLLVLVTPIDSAAPKGRLILPQVQILRDILDNNAIAVVTKEHQLQETMQGLKEKPKLVITDSQVFKIVAEQLPEDIKLTSFSILFARQKGDLQTLIEGAKAIDSLQIGDKVLIAEACTHNRTHEDIGMVKIPNLLRKHVGGAIEFVWASGFVMPEDLSPYRLIIHCGGCMITRREMLLRMMKAEQQAVPMVNYGIAIAHMTGILTRSLQAIK